MSNSLPGNPHAAESIEADIAIGESAIAPEGITDATMIASVIQANTSATIALAHEQRTANLIAFASLAAEFGRREIGDPFVAEAQARLKGGQS